MSLFVRLAVVFLFILSGLTSLVYESLWIRSLSLSLGSTSSSMSLVLSIFFFGMSLGSFLSGQIIAKIKNPIKTYGCIEGFIGLYGLFLIYLVQDLTPILNWFPGIHDNSSLLFFFKAIIIFIILGPPTIAMGSTLPILIRALSQKNKGVGKNVSFLYAVNTVGGVVGAYCSGFLFIPSLGVIGSNHLMVALNLFIFVICFALSKQLSGDKKQSKTAPKISVRLFQLPKWKQAVILSCGLVGFSSIGSEVIWNKYLGLFLGTNIFGLSLILAIFLFGIAVGSYLLSLFIDKIQDKLKFYILLLTASIFAIILSTQALNWAPVASNIINYYAQWFDLFSIRSLLVVFILLVPTSLFGALLPLAVSLVADKNDEAPTVTGKIYAINTWGAILGSALTGLWFIPTYGSGASLIILNAILLFALIGVIYTSHLNGSTRVFSYSAATILIVFLTIFPTVQFTHIIKSADQAYLSKGQSFEEVTRFFTKGYDDIVFLKEGKTAIISLNYEADLNGYTDKDQLRMKTNGLNETYYDKNFLDVIPKYEGLLGLLPYLHHENPKSAFVVGYGGGYTTDLLTSLPIPFVHVTEIEPSVLKAADYIYKGKNPIVKRPNLKLEIEDARFIMNSKKHSPYDIIVSQPSHSWISGVANLFTKEFFIKVKGNLTEKGIFAQWLNLYNMDLKSLKSILSTYYSVFPNGVIYTDETDYQIILLGSKSPLKLNFNKLQQMTNDPNWRHRLTYLPFKNPYEFLTSFSSGRDTIVSATKGAQVNTDVNAYAELRQSRLFYTQKSEEQLTQPFLSSVFDANFGNSIEQLKVQPEKFLYSMLKALSNQQKYEKYFKLIKVYEDIVKPSNKNLALLGDVCFQIERYRCAINNFRNEFMKNKKVKSLNQWLTSLNSAKRFTTTLQVARSYKAKLNRQSRCLMVEAAVALNRPNHALLKKTFRKGSANFIKQCGTYANRTAGQYYLQKAKAAKALTHLEKMYETSPEDLTNLALLIQAHLSLKNYSAASQYSKAFDQARENEVSRVQTLANYYTQQGWTKDAEVLNKNLETLAN